MKKIALFVETPFQLLCAAEAIRHFGAPYLLIIRLSGVGSNDAQLDAVSKYLGLSYLKLNANKDFPYIGLFVFLMKNIQCFFCQYDVFFQGSYFSRLQRLLSRLIVARRRYYMDDGVATFLAQKKFASSSPRDLFTIFDLEPLCNQDVISNRLTILSEKLDGCSKKRCPGYFIGQPLVQKDMVGLKEYVSLIKKAKDDSGGELVYISHRVEEKKLLEIYGEIEGVSIKEIDESVEVYLVKNNFFPENVYGVVSTALYSLSIIYPDSKFFFILPERGGLQDAPHYKEMIGAANKIKNANIIKVA